MINIQNLLEYEPTTGNLLWKESRQGGVKVGDIAGTQHHTGYRIVKIGQKIYQAHRVAWLLFHGYFPENELDTLTGCGTITGCVI